MKDRAVQHLQYKLEWHIKGVARWFYTLFHLPCDVLSSHSAHILIQTLMRQKRSVSCISTHLASAKGEGNGLSRKADPEVGLAARPRHTSPSSSTLPTYPTECVPFAAGQRPCIPQDPTIRAR